MRIFFIAAGCADKGWLPSSNAVQVGATAQRYTKLLLWVVVCGSYFPSFFVVDFSSSHFVVDCLSRFGETF